MLNRAVWPLVLAAMVVVTAVCTVLYLLAPFESPEELEADVGLPGMVEPADRVTAVTDTGDLVVLQAETGELSEVVLRLGDARPDQAVVVDERHEVAYLDWHDPDRPDAIVRVHLKTGKAHRVGEGTAPALGLLHHPHVPRTMRGPEVELLAFLSRAGDATVVVENTTTGSRRLFPPQASDDLGHVTTATWDAFANRLYLTGPHEGGRLRLWELDIDRGRNLGDARLVGPDGPDGETEWVGVANLVDRLAVIERSPSGESSLVAVDRGTYEPVGPLLDETIGDVAWIDAGPDQRRLLIVTTDGVLYRWDATTGEAPVHLADGIVSAAW